MIRQERDPAFVNRIANNPAVRPFVDYRGVAEPMDWSPAVDRIGNLTDIIILSNGEDAVGVFAPSAPRRYQVHTLFGPTCRGRRAVETARAMLDWMKPHADAIWGATPVRNCAARWFNRQLGAMPERRETYDVEGEVEIFELRLG